MFGSVGTDPATDTGAVSYADLEAARQAAEDVEHAEAATVFQAQADEAVAAGDYASAATAREAAEDAAWEAGDDNLLHGSDSSDLEHAGYLQETAEHHQELQAEAAAAGDYETAREEAGLALGATADADWHAGGEDHTAAAEEAVYQQDWAVYEQRQADDSAHAAEAYAEAGMTDQAAIYAESAAEHAEAADYHSDLGTFDETGSVAGVESTIDTSYDPGIDTTSAYDTSASTYDTSASTYDTSSSTYDTTDTV